MTVSPPPACSSTSPLRGGKVGGSGKGVLCPNGPGQVDSYFLGVGLPHYLCFSFPSCDWIKHSCLTWRKDLDQSREPGAGGAGYEGGMHLRAGPGLVSLRLYRLL